MKFLSLLTLLIPMSMPILAKTVEKGSQEFQMTLDYATLEATVACVTLYHPQTEGEELPQIYFLNKDEYKAARELRESDYSLVTTLQGGMSCDQDNMTMKHVAVGFFDSHSEIKAKIMKVDGAIKGKVIFVNSHKLREDTRAKKLEVIKSLVEQ